MIRHTLKILQDFYSVSDHFWTLYIKGLNLSFKNLAVSCIPLEIIKTPMDF